LTQALYLGKVAPDFYSPILGERSMSKPLLAKTALAQAVGLAVVGAGVSDALAQDNQQTVLRISSYNLDVKTDDISKYSGFPTNGTGDAEASNAYKFDLTVPLAAKWDLRLSASKFDADGDPATYKYASSSALINTSSTLASIPMSSILR
jgi:hypothetical protein